MTSAIEGRPAKPSRAARNVALAGPLQGAALQSVQQIVQITHI
jgi:hypothetical protein